MKDLAIAVVGLVLALAALYLAQHHQLVASAYLSGAVSAIVVRRIALTIAAWRGAR